MSSTFEISPSLQLVYKVVFGLYERVGAAAFGPNDSVVCCHLRNYQFDLPEPRLTMKARFTNIDIVAAVCELQELVGLRVTNVYDVDHKVYLFKFAKPDSKVVLLMESGIRVHTTEFEWPKNHSPSGFAMKLRKHIRNRRLEGIRQLGVDRIVDLQFGSREAAYHVILELYDRGNIILTDHAHTILNVLRPRTDQDTDVRYVVHEIYPLEVAKQWTSPPAEKDLNEMFQSVPNKEQLKKVRLMISHSST